ncbi:MAG: hypothetical protein HY815_13335 [Candidatus Riflebacteria bacterium]|nr:hypothetical protein [Candidatus Riflebacteria bacterium]
MFWGKAVVKKKAGARLKVCPLVSSPCLREQCQMYRKTVTSAGYCGLAARDQEECFKVEYESEDED